MEVSCMIILVFLTFNYLSYSQIINTEIGEIVGHQVIVDIDGKEYNVSEYLGIPYAKPPTGELRFKKPQKIGYVGTYFANSFGASCPQLVAGLLPGNISLQSEDCLTLNVFVPNKPSDKPTTGHAVVVWIHGGGFMEGSSDKYNATFLATYGNVIVVTVNYRLNVFGFLSTSDDNAPGNFGLWDQRMAFQWVQENIGYFGGDKDRVAISGVSAGAVSCMLQGLVPDKNPLFQRIIAESGSPTTYEVDRNGLRDVWMLAREVGCPTEPTEDLLSCLRNLSSGDILAAVSSARLFNFVPILDKKLMTVDARSLFHMSEMNVPDEVTFFRSLDVLSGFNSHDGVLRWLVSMNPFMLEYFQPTKNDMENIVRRTFASSTKDLPEEILALVNAEYINWKNPHDSTEIRSELTKMLGDISFGVPAVEMAQIHKRSTVSSRNFMYFFTPNPTVHNLQNTPTWIQGASHTDEVPFVFGIERHLPDTDPNRSWQIQLSRKMITFWSNFAKTGDPNYPESVTPYWPEYSMESQHYIELEEQTTNESVHQYLYAQETNFWLNLFPSITQALDKNDGPCVTDAAASPSYSGVIFLVQILFCFLML